MVSANGYNNTRTEDGWRPTHHLVAEAKYGRGLTAADRVKFVDGDKTNLQPENIIVVPRTTKSASVRLAKLYALRAEIDAEIRELESER